jgi:hypothetical protein
MEERKHGQRWSVKYNGKWMLRSRYIWELNFGNIPDGCVIHHIDENKENDDINNLVMMTDYAHRAYHGKNKSVKTRASARKNMIGKNKAEKNGMYGTHEKNPSARKVKNIDTGEIFDCMIDAAKKYGGSQQNIGKVCKGLRNTCAGFKWEYVGDFYWIENKGVKK